MTHGTSNWCCYAAQDYYSGVACGYSIFCCCIFGDLSGTKSTNENKRSRNSMRVFNVKHVWFSINSYGKLGFQHLGAEKKLSIIQGRLVPF